MVEQAELRSTEDEPTVKEDMQVVAAVAEVQFGNFGLIESEMALMFDCGLPVAIIFSDKTCPLHQRTWLRWLSHWWYQSEANRDGSLIRVETSLDARHHRIGKAVDFTPVTEEYDFRGTKRVASKPILVTSEDDLK